MNAVTRIPPVPVIQLHDGVPMADSRDVARYYRREHKSVLRSIREAPCSADFRERNFAPCFIKGLDGKDFTDHVLMTKSGFAFVVLAFTGDAAAAFREDYINAYDRMEAALRQGQVAVDPMVALQDPRNVLKLLGTYAERNIALEAEVAEKSHALVVTKATVAEQRPHVEALRRIAGLDGTFCISDAAKELGIRPSVLFTHMRDRTQKTRWLFIRNGTTRETAMQERLDEGTLVLKVDVVRGRDGEERAVHQVRVTAKGLAKLALTFAPRFPGV
ncbi:phage regulatory protein/antirepressor Ant [Methylobacterium sp. Leaf112]|uniref:phage regulatory protein/antirepressor Ant n=1 Tax=Methylobacterium sp. Leaf112 TaxID=1736258 RepID=UPI0006FF0340|nr:phage regulatory protein/antirepressor Ant [Methylobacterium sp. Leaf112]KQP62166.1 hypothetical protein ASF52_05775 [Methylobacterium sp. Leaf112]